MKNLEFDSWEQVKKALEEETPSGYKLACIEARKVFVHKLKGKNVPIDNLINTINLFSYKFTNIKDLKNALEKTEKIINEVNYKLSNFEAEDIVEIFTQAVKDLDEMDQMTISKKMMISVAGEGKRRVNYKLYLLFFLSFLLIVKFLTYTKIGNQIVSVLINLADFIFSWFLLIILATLGIFVFIIITFAGLDRKKTKIKSIKEK